MKRWTAFFVIAAVVITAASVWGLGTGKERLFKAAEGATVSLEDVIADVKNVKLVFMGEHHTAKSHHEAQLKVIRSLHEADVPLAVGLEMITSQHQAVLDRWVAGNVDEDGVRAVFQQDWGFPWALYRDIFIYARDNKIPMIGLNVSSALSRQVAREGFSSLSEEQLKQLPPVACVVDPEYEKFIRRALGAHGHGSMNFKNFCEAQLLWDTVMAVNLVDFINGNPERSVVVLAGSGHAWELGIPIQVRARSTASYRVILPEIPGRLTPENATVLDADYLWLGL